MPKKALGRGLNAILEEVPAEKKATGTTASAPALAPAVTEPEALAGRRVVDIPLDKIDPNPRQPRRHFNEAKLEELATSIRQEGVLMPVLLVERGERYELIAGERRYRASIMAGMETLPALITESDSRESLKLALVENLQRDDLDPIEEARAFQVMIYEFGWTHEELGNYLGRDRSTVSNTLRLLQLPDPVQDQVAQGGISAGHVRALINLEEADCLRLAKTIERGQLSVRQAERMAKKLKGGPAKAKNETLPGDPVLLAIRERMEGRVGLPVQLDYRKGRGKVTVRFKSDRELERLMDALQVSLDSDI
ncbi:ParB/RepB/Spo0J family partition protein [bacterium]|nr:ParB/RepB/Spo0J family partition protein [bacterium]